MVKKNGSTRWEFIYSTFCILLNLVIIYMEIYISKLLIIGTFNRWWNQVFKIILYKMRLRIYIILSYENLRFCKTGVGDVDGDFLNM